MEVMEVMEVLGLSVLDCVLDLSLTTYQRHNRFNFFSPYEICHKKKGFFICFCTWLKGYDGWQTIGPYPEG
jgi:hypothetical protein